MAKIILSPQFSRQIINLSLHEISELFTESVLMVIKSQNKHNKSKIVKFTSEVSPFTIATHNNWPKFTAEEGRTWKTRCFFHLDWYTINLPEAIVEATAHSEILKVSVKTFRLLPL